MIDVDLIKLLPKSFEDLQNNFKLSSILPGGSHCMMNTVSILWYSCVQNSPKNVWTKTQTIVVCCFGEKGVLIYIYLLRY